MERFKGRSGSSPKGSVVSGGPCLGGEAPKEVAGGKRKGKALEGKSAKLLRGRMICLKAMFTLFKVGQGRLPECSGTNRKFLHAKKKAEVDVGELECQLREIKRKSFTDEDLETLLVKAKAGKA